jgi:hypothetical protein
MRDRRCDARGERRSTLKELRRAFPAAAEPEVLAHRDVTGPQPVLEPVRDELARRHRGDDRVEVDHDELLDSQLGHRLEPLLEGGEQVMVAGAPEHHRRRRVEGQHAADTADDLAMAQMDCVEHSDRQIARTSRDVVQTNDAGGTPGVDALRRRWVGSPVSEGHVRIEAGVRNSAKVLRRIAGGYVSQAGRSTGRAADAGRPWKAGPARARRTVSSSSAPPPPARPRRGCPATTRRDRSGDPAGSARRGCLRPARRRRPR